MAGFFLNRMGQRRQRWCSVLVGPRVMRLAMPDATHFTFHMQRKNNNTPKGTKLKDANAYLNVGTCRDGRGIYANTDVPGTKLNPQAMPQVVTGWSWQRLGCFQDPHPLPLCGYSLWACPKANGARARKTGDRRPEIGFQNHLGSPSFWTRNA